MNRMPHDSCPFRGERGAAMIMSIFMLAVVGMMGVALLFMTQLEMKMSKSSLRLKKVFYLAEAGEEHGRGALWEVNGSGDFTDDLQAHAGVDGAFNFDPQTVRVQYASNGTPTGLIGFGDDVPLVPLTPFGEGWYAAFLTNDPAEGATTTTDVNEHVMIAGIGIGADRSVEIVRSLVRKDDLFDGVPPATITLLGPLPEFDGGHSDPHYYAGNDCNDGESYVPVVGTIGEEAEASAELGIYYDEDGAGPEYESGTYIREDTFADLTNPADEPTLSEAIDDAWTECTYVQDLVDTLRTFPDIYCCMEPYCETDSECVLPPADITNLIFIDGDFDIGPEGGAGMLVVTGELGYDGRASWEGAIFAFGEGRFTRHGAGNGSISGAVMVADIAGDDQIYGNADDCQNGFDTVAYRQTGGGKATTNYCSESVNAAKPEPPYEIIAFRQY